MKLLLASNNPKKRAELEAILARYGISGIEVVTPAELGGIDDVEEDGETFLANAEKKALASAAATGLHALADDSGLAVDALDGAPGVRSARFAGEPSDDSANNAKLLRLLDGVAEGERGAAFHCALVLASPGPPPAVLTTAVGTVRGRILEASRGESGFGYDPLFLFTEPGQPGTGKAFAELDPVEKAAISHRGRALEQLVRAFPAALGI
ncbi:MAG TPA: RdgB/HAM1 family non-canonical purine NTP pyrophosphatase [Planctomycetes bacterium]|nr:RdgB/HAM1 family non-canonical purine NTP pyrophosphatase [Planctomycetota bacterium]